MIMRGLRGPYQRLIRVSLEKIEATSSRAELKGSDLRCRVLRVEEVWVGLGSYMVSEAGVVGGGGWAPAAVQALKFGAYQDPPQPPLNRLCRLCWWAVGMYRWYGGKSTETRYPQKGST